MGSKQPIVVVFVILVIVSTILRSFHLYFEEEMGNTEKGVITVHRRVVLNSLGNCQAGLKGGDCYQHSLRLLNYCSLNPPEGSEGIFNNAEEFELSHVTLTIRHGDRTAIHSIPGSEPKTTASSNSLLDARASHFTPRLASFRVNLLPGSNPQAILSSMLTQTLSPEKIFRTGDSSLGPGQLTSVGFMQHVQLGFLLSKAYGSLISSVQSQHELYVRSTNYDRTIQSAAALLSTLTPNVGGPSESNEIVINSFVDEADEVMHGVGMRSSSHNVGPTGEAVSLGTCKRASRLQQIQKDAFEDTLSTKTSIRNIFGSDAADRMVTDLVDGALPSYCHGEQLPCAASATAGWTGGACMKDVLLGDMMVDADRAYCNRFNGVNGGLNATRLSLYPFLSEILSGLKAAAATPNAPIKLALFSGHDTVIAPVLAALGVYEHFCKWPSYASRISFELWRRKPRSNVSSRLVSFPSLRSSVPVETPPESAAASEHFVRVVFNGQDVTHLIPSCSGSVSLCPLHLFARQVEGLLGPFPALEEACL